MLSDLLDNSNDDGEYLDFLRRQARMREAVVRQMMNALEYHDSKLVVSADINRDTIELVKFRKE